MNLGSRLSLDDGGPSTEPIVYGAFDEVPSTPVFSGSGRRPDDDDELRTEGVSDKTVLRRALVLLGFMEAVVVPLSPHGRSTQASLPLAR